MAYICNKKKKSPRPQIKADYHLKRMGVTIWLKLSKIIRVNVKVDTYQSLKLVIKIDFEKNMRSSKRHIRFFFR